MPRPAGSAGLPLPRYELLDLRRYGWLKTFSVQSSRGCPLSCEFCSERLYLGQAYRHRPAREIVEEIQLSQAKNILFADSNFAGNLGHSMELMEAMIPLGVRWSALWLAQKSGVLHVNIGMESIDPDTLASMNKRATKVAEYEGILNVLRSRGISYSLNFIFGWDTQTEAVFPATLTFLAEHKVPAAHFNILTPDKGTRLYDRMKEENRLLNIDAIGRWPGDRCFLKPRHFSPGVLEHRVREMDVKFYSYRSMLSRLPFPRTKADLASWIAMREDSMESFDLY
jgi:radical SAM superfamily enzyme YgiQ (UPF0313 family)